jgi:D-glycero-D-manno-heptose 1,7-bisphosphate phosphatase
VNRGAVFLDRDGTLNELVPDPITGDPESPLRPEEVVLIPNAAAGAKRFLDAGWLLIGVSNQPAAAKQLASLSDLEAVQRRVLELLTETGVSFQDFRVCHHHPDGQVAGLAGACNCRKPRPGMLLQAAAASDVSLSASWMIGDTDADVTAGAAAGCRTCLLENPGSSHKRSGLVRPTFSAPDLETAAATICSGGW